MMKARRGLMWASLAWVKPIALVKHLVKVALPSRIQSLWRYLPDNEIVGIRAICNKALSFLEKLRVKSAKSGQVLRRRVSTQREA
ncbi:hypothetical protein KSB_44690 [Ktedonobacter robiniae]|uniref:Secreted protein n=1 Tax=Ktedonobacter robiniae TaxID=2778365 RepID=A0ABQ3UT40_9CHLR|nr:hypothetical protein KSB_44690 [Ktedonobacter robiniae]